MEIQYDSLKKKADKNEKIEQKIKRTRNIQSENISSLSNDAFFFFFFFFFL